MDARTRSYPPLPARPPQRIVVPRQGDLRVRPLVPLAFLQELAIHCPPEHRHVYRRFRVTRQFIVMARTGDMYAKTATLELRLEDLPGRSLLPLPPPLAPWDVVKVLDLVQCYTYPPNGHAIVPNVRWELVRVRWRNSRESWIPIELMASQSPTLLQEFYVNSINSWAFHSRVHPQSWSRYRTEIELWLHHPEFQKLYEQLRRRLLVQTNTQANSTAGQSTADVKDRRLTAEAARATPVQRHPTPPLPQQQQRPHTSSQPHSQPPQMMPHPPQPSFVVSSQSVPPPQPSHPHYSNSQPQQYRPPHIATNQHLMPPPSHHHLHPQTFTATPNHANNQPLYRYLPNAPLPLPNGHVHPPQRPAPALHHYPSPSPSQSVPSHHAMSRPQPPVQPPQHHHHHSNGAHTRIPQPHPTVVSLSQRPPNPPTPPRPSQERPVELQRTMPPPPITLPPPAEQPPARQHEHNMEHKQKSKEYHTGKSPDRERHIKEKKKERRESSQREGASPVRDREKERKKKKEREREYRTASQRSPVGVKETKQKKKEKKKREASPESTKQLQRKRLKWSQTAAASESEESDDLLEAALRKSSRATAAAGEMDKQRRKRLRRLRRATADPPETIREKDDVPIIVIDDSDEEDDEDAMMKKKKKKKKRDKEKEKEMKRSDKKKQKRKTREETEEANEMEEVVAETEEEVAVEIDVDAFSDVGDDDGDDEGDDGALLMGEIRCVCGIKTVGRYTGQWVQCWQEECGVWQHAECVGFLVRRGGATTDLPEKYCCSNCDQEAYKKRYSEAKSRLRQWLSLCCASRNQKQLLKLLEENEDAMELMTGPFDSSRVTLLMETARQGLAHAVRRLVRRYKINLFALDAQSRNVLHYAAESESPAVVVYLMSAAKGLVRHQDLRGQMPLHRLLTSSLLNSYCLPLLQNDQSLCVTSDFDGAMPIHFACQVVNQHTVEIVRQILAVHPLMGIDKSPERLTPLMYLCRASGGGDLIQKASYVAQLLDELLDIDALGECLSARDPRGWTPLHFAAQAGNHALLWNLCHQNQTDIHAVTFDSGETALHLAARKQHPKCLQVLLTNRRGRLDVGATDGMQWIPLLFTATSTACRQQLLCYDLERQLRHLSVLARNFRHHDALRQWMRSVISDPTSYGIVNDWLQYHTPLLDELDQLLELHRSFVRVDCKLDYLYGTVFPSVQRSTVSESQVEIMLSSSTGECYWQQFVAQTRDLDPFVFRARRLHVAISRGGNLRLDSLTLVLVRLLAGLLHPTTGLLVRSDTDTTLAPSPHRKADDPETRREYFVLGQLVAYLALSDVPVSDVFEFATDFLSAVVGQRVEPVSGIDAFTLRVFAESFAVGFDGVLPATLSLLQPEELRIVLNARSHSLQVSTMDWVDAIEWIGFPGSADENDPEEDKGTKGWWRRLVRELVEDERVALVLWLAGSFRHAQRVLFAVDESDADPPRVRIERFEAVASDERDVEENALAPVLTPATRTLVLPQYDSYDRFRTAVLQAFRRADDVAVR